MNTLFLKCNLLFLPPVSKLCFLQQYNQNIYQEIKDLNEYTIIICPTKEFL